MLLSSFVSLTPITTIIACNRKDQIDDGSDRNWGVELLNQIKTEINKEFSEKESSILDYNSFIGLSEADLFKILESYYTKMTNIDRIEIDNNQISQYFINKINHQLVVMNKKLKDNITQLSNLPFDIVSIGANNLFLEKLSYEQIINVIKNLGQDTTYSYNDPNPKIFKLKFNLSFKIKIDNIREEEYIFPEFQHFITDNISDINSKLSDISNSLHEKLQNTKISLENILTEQGELSGNLNQKLIDAIKTNFNNKNPGLNLKFDKLSNLIKEEDLSFQLKTLKHTNNNGVTANDEGTKYYKNFVNTILKSNANMIQGLYTNNDDLKKINGGRVPGSGPVNIKSFSYIPLNLSISDINIPMINSIETYLTLEQNIFIEYLEQFRTFLDEYFTLIKAGEVEFLAGASRKIVTIKRESINNVWSPAPVKALEVDFKQTIFPKMENVDKQYFKMNFNGFGWPRNLDDGTHWYNVTVTFIFKIFTIKFLDDEQIRFKYE